MATTRDRGRTAVVTAGLCAGIAAFQVALVAGQPWGELAWGGQHVGVLPTRMRVASGVSALVWTGAAVVAAHPGSGHRWLRARMAFAVVGLAGAAMNAISPSVPERVLWTPVAATVGVGFALLARRDQFVADHRNRLPRRTC